MKRAGLVLKLLGILVAATVGAGIFALPEIFLRVGFARAAAYLIFAGLAIAYLQYRYWRVVEKEGMGLLGLVRKFFGRRVHALASWAVVGGLLSALVAYLALTKQFAEVFGFESGVWGALVLWFFATLLAFSSLRRFAVAQTAAAALTFVSVFIVFFAATHPGVILGITPTIPSDFAVPVGVALFALAGWTAILPMAEIHRASEKKGKHVPKGVIFGGIAVVLIIYFGFVAGVLGNRPADAPLGSAFGFGLPGWEIIWLAIVGTLEVAT